MSQSVNSCISRYKIMSFTELFEEVAGIVNIIKE